MPLHARKNGMRMKFCRYYTTKPNNRIVGNLVKETIKIVDTRQSKKEQAKRNIFLK